MKYFFCTCILLVIFSSSYSQNSAIIKYDSTSHFNGDLPIGVFQMGKGIVLIRIKSNDSTFLDKTYSNNILLKSVQCDLEERQNGYAYYFDTINRTTTNAINSKGRTVVSYTLNSNLDTIRLTRKINDTLVYWMDIKNGEKRMWQTNANNVYNGYYKSINLETNKITVDGNYLAIKQSEIIDEKKYRSLLKKNNHDESWRGEGSVGEDLETEIPIGVWYIYDKNGKLLKTIKYNWDGMFNTK